MPKWAIGCLAALVLGVGGLAFFLYRQYQRFTSAGPSARVTIAASTERVFASLADADSMKTWRQGLGFRSTRRGMLQLGDTVFVRTRMPTDTAETRMAEIVTELVPGRLLVSSTHNDTLNANVPMPPPKPNSEPASARSRMPPIIIMTQRRDSLIARGDSTEVVSTFLMPGVDSLRGIDSTGERGMMDVATKLATSVARMAFGADLRRLKARIEGTPVQPPR